MCRINDAQSAKSIKKSVVALLVDPSRPGPLSIKTRGDTAGEGRDIQPSCSALILEHIISKGYGVNIQYVLHTTNVMSGKILWTYLQHTHMNRSTHNEHTIQNLN